MLTSEVSELEPTPAYRLRADFLLAKLFAKAFSAIQVVDSTHLPINCTD
jgi:hypothetical protein